MHALSLHYFSIFNFQFSILSFQFSVLNLRYWIIATSTPRIARKHALEREPRPFEGAVFAQSLNAVVGAGGGVSA